MRELAFLNKGIKITFTDNSQKKEKILEFKYDGGLIEFVDYLDEKREKLQNKNGNDLFRKPIYIEGKRKLFEYLSVLIYQQSLEVLLLHHYEIR